MRLKPIFLAVAAALAFTLPAAAQQSKRGNETLKKYCTGDYLTYCGDFAPDTPELNACFKQNKTKLSTNCQAAIATYVRDRKKS